MAFKILKVKVFESEENTETPIETVTIRQQNWRQSVREFLAKYDKNLPIWFNCDGLVGWANLSNLKAELRGK